MVVGGLLVLSIHSSSIDSLKDGAQISSWTANSSALWRETSLGLHNALLQRLLSV